MKVTLETGALLAPVSKGELRDALAEDAAQRAVTVGVKTVEQFFNAAQIGGVNAFATPPGMIGAGYAWSLMAAGFELTAASQVRVYKQAVPASVFGGARLVTQITGSTLCVSGQFAKGQCVLRAGDQLAFFSFAAANMLSIFLTAIQVPIERIGELLL